MCSSKCDKMRWIYSVVNISVDDRCDNNTLLTKSSILSETMNSLGCSPKIIRIFCFSSLGMDVLVKIMRCNGLPSTDLDSSWMDMMLCHGEDGDLQIFVK